MPEGYNGLPPYYVQSSDPITPNLFLSLIGMDPIVAENFVLIDAAVGAGSSVRINGTVIPNVNFVNSATVTFNVTGSNVSATAITGGTGTVTSVGTSGIATGGPITAAGVINVAGSGSTLVAATAAPNLGAAPAGDVITADGSGNVQDSGVLLSSLQTGGTVTSVSFTGGLISVATPTTTPALTVAGTSGGIPYFSSGTTWASSALLPTGGVLYGGGAGNPPTTNVGFVFTPGPPVNLTLGINGTSSGTLTAQGSNTGSNTFAAGPNSSLAITSSGALTVVATGSNNIQLSSNGQVSSILFSSYYHVGSAMEIGWSSTAAASTTSDTGLSRISAGVIGVGTGAVGSTAGTIQAQIFGVVGSTSGIISITALTGTYNFNLPITAGTAGQVLTSQAGGAASMTWTTLATTESFSAITSGTNTVAAMIVGSGASLTESGTGTITANKLAATVTMPVATTFAPATGSTLAITGPASFEFEDSTGDYITMSGGLEIGDSTGGDTIQFSIGNKQITFTATNGIVSASTFILNGALEDGTSSVGTSGQVLSSTVTGTQWITSTGTPGGPTNSVQTNNGSGGFAGSAALTFSTAASISNTTIGAVGVGSGEVTLLGTTSGSSTIATGATGLLTITGGTALVLAAATAQYVGLQIGGTLYTAASTTYLNVGKGVEIGWSSTTQASGSADTAFSRISAGVVGVGTGAAASVAGTLDAATINLGAVGGSSGTLNLLGTTSGTSTLAVNATGVLTITSPSAVTITGTGNITVATVVTGAGIVDWSINGALVGVLETNLMHWGSGAEIGWSSTAAASATSDTGLSRIAADSIAFGNGTAGDFSAALKFGTLNATSNLQSMIGSIAFITSASAASSSPSIRSSAAAGQLVINSGGANALLFNYDSGTGGVQFANGTSTVTASVSSTGVYSSGAGTGVSAGPFTAVTSITTVGGIVTALSGTSDERLKNAQPYEGGLAIIEGITPVRYTWNDKGQLQTGLFGNREYVGFLAQDVQKAIPEAITATEKSKDGTEDYLSFDDRPIIAALVNAVKELKAELYALKARL